MEQTSSLELTDRGRALLLALANADMPAMPPIPESAPPIIHVIARGRPLPTRPPAPRVIVTIQATTRRPLGRPSARRGHASRRARRTASSGSRDGPREPGDPDPPPQRGRP